MADATLPGARETVQRRVQKVHSTLEEQNATMLAAEQAALAHVVRQDVLERRKPGYRLRVLDGLVFGRSHQAVRYGWKLGCGSLCRVDNSRQRGGRRRTEHWRG